MPEIEFSLVLLTVLLFIVAFIYSSVGLGGGSSYTALLAIFSIHYLAIPVISLTLNLIVSSLGTFNFIRSGHARLKLILPFLLSSIPMAYIGGSVPLPQDIFLWVLWISLFFVMIRIYFMDHIELELNLTDTSKLIISIIAGMLLGFVAGVVGIGGGIYLIPLILILGLGSAKEAAACGVIFVFVNSATGLFARTVHQPVNMLDYIPLIIAVLIGGLLGSWLGANRYSSKTIEKWLGIVVIVAIFFLGKKLITQII